MRRRRSTAIPQPKLEPTVDSRRSADSFVRVLVRPIFRNARTRLSALLSCASESAVPRAVAGVLVYCFFRKSVDTLRTSPLVCACMFDNRNFNVNDRRLPGAVATPQVIDHQWLWVRSALSFNSGPVMQFTSVASLL